MFGTIILSKFLGLFFTLCGLGVLFNLEHCRAATGNIVENRAVQHTTTLISLFFGAFLVTTHNVWVQDWSVLLTIVGWMFLAIGVVRAIFPAQWNQYIRNNQQAWPVLFGCVSFCFGILLLYAGYFQ